MKMILTIMIVLTSAGAGFSQELSGKVHWSALEKEAWYQEGVKATTPDPAQVAALKTNLPGYQLVIFGGSWCGHTRQHLPGFVSTLKAAGISPADVTFYFVDSNLSSQTSSSPEVRYKVNSVPTFIVMKNNKETGRITMKDGDPIARLMQLTSE